MTVLIILFEKRLKKYFWLVFYLIILYYSRVIINLKQIKNAFSNFWNDEYVKKRWWWWWDEKDDCGRRQSSIMVVHFLRFKKKNYVTFIRPRMPKHYYEEKKNIYISICINISICISFVYIENGCCAITHYDLS